MDRRQFLCVAATLALPLAARAQSTGMPVVGFLNTTSPDSYAFNAEAFRQGLATQGFVERKNVVIEYRWANGDYNLMPSLAKELASLNVAVIAATGDLVSAHAAQAASASIPIVFTIGSDPIKFGLVKSMNLPGGNLTGMTLFSSTLVAKRLELLTQLVPNVRTIGLLMNPANTNAAADLEEAREAARQLGRQTVVVNARSQNELPTAFEQLIQQNADAALIASDPFMLNQRVTITGLAAQHAIPTLYWSREFAFAGGLASYGTGVTWMYREAGVYCGKILKGSKPADLPVLQPTKFDFVINLKTAKALGLDVPDKLLALADEVIE
jgi:putative tryptophan/tyrosine transport system substrate-binding protein